jgi:hypothetical protein
MMEPNQPRRVSITSAYAAVGLIGLLFVVGAHPLSAGFCLLGAGAVALLGRATWQQATSRGLSLPGTARRLQVETDGGHREKTHWSLTVSVTEN